MNFITKYLHNSLNFRIFALQIAVATQRNATQRNATQRNATQRNATQRNATQRNATQRLSYALIKSIYACAYTFSAHIQLFVTNFFTTKYNFATQNVAYQADYGHSARNRLCCVLKLG